LCLKVNFKRGKAKYLVGVDLGHGVVPLIDRSLTPTRACTMPVTTVTTLNKGLICRVTGHESDYPVNQESSVCFA